MLEVLLLALEIMQMETEVFGLEINWSKTKIQTTVDLPPSAGNKVLVNGNEVEIVGAFTYLGSTVHSSGNSEQEATRRIAITCECMRALDKNIWHSPITLATKLRLYNAYIVPVLISGAETWTMTVALRTKLVPQAHPQNSVA